MTSNDNSEPRILPEDYQPSDDTVWVGRGKKCLVHEGNRRLRLVVKDELQSYQESRSKSDKSIILLRLVRQIRKRNEDGVGFVKQDLCSGRWYELTEFASRVAVAQCFRDALAGHYKSSKQSKQHRRNLEKLQECGPKQSAMTPPPIAAGTGLSVNDAIAVARMRNQFLAKNGCANLHPSFSRAWAATQGNHCPSVQSAISSALSIMDPSRSQMMPNSGMCPPMMSWNMGYAAQASMSPVTGVYQPVHYPNQGCLPPQVQPHGYVNQVGNQNQFRMAAESLDSLRAYSSTDTLNMNVQVEDTARQERVEAPAPSLDDVLAYDEEKPPKEDDIGKQDLYEVFNSIPLPDLKAALSA